MAAVVANSWPDRARWSLKLTGVTDGLRSNYFFTVGFTVGVCLCVCESEKARERRDASDVCLFGEIRMQGNGGIITYE